MSNSTIFEDVTNTGTGTGNREQETGNRKEETGNGEPGTGVWKRVYSGNPPENSKWRTKRRFQTLILSLGRVDARLAFI